MNYKTGIITLSLPWLLATPVFARVADEVAERTAANHVIVSWSDQAPVDVYMSDSADASVPASKLVSRHNRTGRYEVLTTQPARPFFLLKDSKDGSVVRVAERLVPLEQGSNFRDLGGYPAADGKHVRWGLIYRSGATPMLTDADISLLHALRMKDVIDLRSREERSLAPTRIQDVRYASVDYSLTDHVPTQGPISAASLYGSYPALLVPQLRILFRTLLADEGPLAYNCSAGQDRTGFATAMVLTALGVPRNVIFADYLLSPTYRRPQFEMPKLDASMQSNNPIGAFFARAQQDPRYLHPPALVDANQQPLLAASFTQIEGSWGSVEGYLEKEIGINAADIAKLRSEYLE